MFKKPLVLGVIGSDSPDSSTLEKLLERLGRNSGNLLFTEGICKSISNSKCSFYDLSPEIIEDRDSIVIAAANWLANGQDFSWLAERLEQTTLPVNLVGIGAQASLGREMPKLKPGTKKLLDLVNERSNSISVRGEFTAEVLNHHGFKNVTVTGCPSLMLAGRTGFSIKKPKDLIDRDVCIQSTRHLFNGCDQFQNYLYRQGISRNIDIVLQSEYADMYYSLGRTNNAEVLAKAIPPLRDSYGTSRISDVAVYLRDHGKVFFNVDSWLDYLKRKEFCVGTRIHGTVAALLAGTPSTLIVHDSRTEEMAITMHIPYVYSSSINLNSDLIFESLYNGQQIEKFGNNYGSYMERFLNFFQTNQLETSTLFTV